MPRYTVKQAAAALGVSIKTIRRRIAEGDLSATKETRGKQELLFIEGSELARHAEVSNLRLSVDRLGQGENDGDGEHGQASAPLPEQTIIVHDEDSTERGPSEDIARQVSDIIGHTRTSEDLVEQLRTALAEARAREVWLQERLQASEEAAVRERERASDERQRLLDLIPKALPPARTWWQRVFRGKGDGGHA